MKKHTGADKVFSDRTEIAISNMLRFGVISAALLTLAGGFCYMIKYASAGVNFSTFIGASSEFRSVFSVIKEALSLNCKGIIQAGVLVLLATPIARVALSVFIFLKQRDYIYVVITLIVLSVLIFSLMGGRIQI